MEKTLYSRTWCIGKDTNHEEFYQNNYTQTQIEGYFYKNGKLEDASHVENFNKKWADKKYDEIIEYSKLYPADTITYQLKNSAAWVDKYNIVHINYQDDCKFFPEMVCVHNNNYIIYRDGYISKAKYINDFDKTFKQYKLTIMCSEVNENYKRDYYKYDGDRLGVVEYHNDKVFINDSVLLKVLEKNNLPVYLKHIINPGRIVEEERLLKEPGNNEFKIISKQGNGVLLYETNSGITAISEEVDNIIIIDNPKLIYNIESDKPIYYRDSTGKCRLYGSKDFNKDSYHLFGVPPIRDMIQRKVYSKGYLHQVNDKKIYVNVCHTIYASNNNGTGVTYGEQIYSLKNGIFNDYSESLPDREIVKKFYDKFMIELSGLEISYCCYKIPVDEFKYYKKRYPELIMNIPGFYIM